MASYEKTVDILDSANSYYGSIRSIEIYRANGSTFVIPPRDETLHLAYQRKNGRTVTQADPMFLPDYSQIPKNKRIKKIKLYFYAKSSYSEKVSININDYPTATEETLTDVQLGWNTIEAVTRTDNNGLWRGYVRLSEFDSEAGYDYGLGKWLEIYSHLSSYKPYAIVTYEDIPPKAPTSLYPDKTTVNARNVIRFSWVHNSTEKTKQKGFTLQYSKDGGSTWTTVTQTTANQYYDLPASTLPTTGEIMWRVKTMDQNGLESSYQNAKFNTAIVPPKAPVLKHPTTGYLDGEKDIKFEWEFVQGTSEDVQNKYDFEYSLNKGSTWTKITKSSSNQHHIIPANTLSSGSVYWRVKTYNQFGDTSPYSEIANFYVIASPPLPQITSVTNNAKPLIKWNSTEQQLFEILIFKDDKTIIDTGQIIGANIREYKIEKYLKDGNYTVKLRVTNEYSLKSPWAELNFTISTVKPLKPTIRLFSSEYSIVIRTEETSLKTLVYRDDKLIGETKEGYFEDYTGENRKEYKYFIRVVDENDNFNDSDIKIGKSRFRDNTLALASKPNDFIKLRYGFNSEPQKTTKVGNVGSLIYFDGRKYPATEFTEFKEYAKTLSFFLRGKRELDNLIELIDKKQTLLYRDSEGENIYGTIFSIDYEKTTFGYDVNFTIMKTSDYYD